MIMSGVILGFFTGVALGAGAIYFLAWKSRRELDKDGLTRDQQDRILAILEETFDEDSVY